MSGTRHPDNLAAFLATSNIGFVHGLGRDVHHSPRSTGEQRMALSHTAGSIDERSIFQFRALATARQSPTGRLARHRRSSTGATLYRHERWALHLPEGL